MMNSAISRNGLLIEENEKIVYVDDRYGRILGYERPLELVGRHVSVVVSPEDESRMLDFGRRRERGESAPLLYGFSGRRQDGTLVPLEARVSASFISTHVYITTTIREIEPPAQGEQRSPRLDKSSTQDFYDHYAPSLYALALRILGNHAGADQVLLEVFLGFRNADANEEDPLSWLARQTRAVALRLRSQRDGHTRVTQADVTRLRGQALLERFFFDSGSLADLQTEQALSPDELRRELSAAIRKLRS